MAHESARVTPLLAHEITGVWATPLLDVCDNGSLNIDGIADQIEHFATVGVDGIYTHGTAAEFHGQSADEFRAFCELAAECANALELPFQIGATHPFAPETLHRIAFARSLQPSAIQIILPDWAPVSLDVAARFLDGCIEAAEGVGLVLYNPPHAKRVLAPEDYVALLSNRPGIVGVKCGGGDSDWYAAMQPVIDRCSVFIPGHFMASGMAQGAQGSYSNVCCLNPAATVAWRDQIACNPEAANTLETRINDFMARTLAPLLAAGFPGYACDKLMAAAGGWTDISTRLKWPYQGIPERHIAQLRSVGREIIPEFF